MYYGVSNIRLTLDFRGVEILLEFREATNEDYDGICRLIGSKEELFLVYPGGRFPLTVDQIKKLSKIRQELTVAVDENEIIGFANLYDYERNKTAFIGNVVVDRSHRGKGLGKEIISYMLNAAFKKHNLPEVRISVFSENTRAVLLYVGFGFSPYKIEERIGPNGNRVALIHMKMER